MHRTLIAFSVAAALASASSALASERVYAAPGLAIIDEWYVLACHPRERQLTVAKREATSGFQKSWSAVLPMHIGDKLALNAENSPLPQATLVNINGCTGQFEIN
ncbi:MAG TPA: hypothetical protein VHC20_01860 [Candidatus Paceibacterota bacterium]|nr:hypothetical protein [Candidatus Paceibacterota bacterium]